MQKGPPHEERAVNHHDPQFWSDPHQVLRKMKTIRQFNELFVHRRPGNDGIIMVNEEGEITFANGKMSDLLGYERDDMVGRRLADLLAPESRPEDGPLPLLAPGEEGGRRCDLVFMDRSQARVPAAVTATDLYHRGNQSGCLLVLVDLRNRRELVEDLKDVQVRLRQSSLELTRRFWELSVIREVAHTLQTTVNLDEMLRIILTGVTAEEGLGFNRAFLLLIDEGSRDQGPRKIRGVLAVGPADDEQARRIWEDMSHHPQSLRELLERHRDDSGRIDPEINQIVRQMEFDLSPESGLVARAILESCSFNVANAGEHPTVDPLLLDLLGTEAFAVVPLVARGNALGAIIADNRYTGRTIGEADVELLETLANHASFAIERARLHERLVEKIRELERAYADLRDSQDQLLRAERLSAVGKMATRLSHELRNPIASIGGFARLIAKNLPSEDPNQEYLNIIIDEITRVETMMTEMLDFVRPKEPSFRPTDLNELVRRVVATLQPSIETGQIVVQLELDPGLPSAEVDPLQISQVLVNLMRNGLEAMSPGGTLWVRTGPSEAGVRIEVQDTGAGIPPEHQGRLFDEFFTTKSAGVGLGLVIAHQTVHHHGGSIELHSQPGEGATFCVHLPISRESGSAGFPEDHAR
jgi:PAS domain S-box-containing protein